MPSADAAGPSVIARDFTVTSSLDGTELVGRYCRPAAKGTYAVVLSPHGGGGTVDGAARRVSLALSHTAVEVAAGHRLQVWVQGSDVPTWLPAQQPAADTVGAGSRLLVPLLNP